MTRRRLTRCTLLALLIVAALPAAASANPISVDTTLDLVSANSQCSLREAISAANGDNTGPSGDCDPGGGADVITLGASVTPYQVARMGFDDTNVGGDLDTTGAGGLTIRGAGADSTVINASPSPKDRVFDNGPTRSLTLEDLTVTGGAAEDGADGDPGTDQASGSGATSTGDPGSEGGYGGGIRNKGNLTLTRVVVIQNSSGDGGAGGAGGNGGSGGDGNPGGDSVGGAGGNGGAGGGIFSDIGTSITITDSAITENSAGAAGPAGAGGQAGAGGDSAGTAGDGGDSIGGDAAFARGGGGIYADNATVIEMTGSTISGNDVGASGAGGAGGSGGQGGTGGGASGNGGESRGGTGTGGGLGGGITAVSTALDLDESSVTGNSAGAGSDGGDGGIGGGGPVTVPSGTGGDSIGGNGGVGGRGGGINQSGVDLSDLSSSLIAGNSAGPGGSGGAGGTGGGGNPGGNSTGGTGGSGAAAGGANLFNVFGSHGNVTVAGNTAGAGGDGGAGGAGPVNSTGGDGGDGGAPAGLLLSSSGSQLDLINLTIANNGVGADSSGGGGGTGSTPTAGTDGGPGLVSGVSAVGGTVVLRQSIVVGQAGRLTCSGTWSDAQLDSVMASPFDLNCPGPIDANPLLLALDDYGGPTETMPPGPGSPAINAGDDGTCLDIDQRGVNRPKGAHCDLGAVEISPPGATTGAATGITATSATLNGSLASGDLAPTHRFDFGKTTAYGSQTPAVTGPGSIPATLTGLQPNTTYHYRLRVTNPDGTALGANGTFKTAAAPPGGGGGGGGGGSASAIGLSIRSRSVRLDRKGRAKIKVRCNAGTTGSCKGTLSLTAKVKRKTLKLGRKKFSIAAGKTKTVTVKISKKGRRLIKSKRKLKVRATAKAKNSAGKTKTAKRKITLKPARKKR